MSRRGEPLGIEERVSYSAIVDRPVLQLPDAARVAVWIVPNVEHYEFVATGNPLRNAWPRTPHPDVLGYSTRDYGNRVGLWRMLEVIDRFGVPCTASLNVGAFERYPEVMQACEERGWDYLCHGIYNTRYHWGMNEQDERDEIAECLQRFRDCIGRTPAGWFGPALSQTVHTPDLVAEFGMQYYCDWVHDEQPFPFHTRSGARLVSVPYSTDLNDAVVLRQGYESADFARMVQDHFDTVYDEGADIPRVMCVAVHPYLMGQPHRIEHFAQILEHLTSRPGVWFATGAQIAQWYYDTMWDSVSALDGDGTPPTDAGAQ